MAAFVPYGNKRAKPEDHGFGSFAFWSNNDRTEEASSLLGGGSAFASRATASMTGALGSAGAMGGDTFAAVKSLMEDPISTNQWIAFGVFLLAGAFLMSLSLLFFPMVLLAPQKFSGLFTLGSLSFFCSFGALRGPEKFFKHLMSSERLPFSCAYVGSMLGTLYSANMLRSYILTIIFTGFQVVALLYFLMAYVPGGPQALSFLFSGCWAFFRGLCGGKRESSLPY